MKEGAQAAVTKTMVKVEEDEAKTIAAINIRRMNNGADDPDTNKEGYDGDGDGNGDGIAMLANGTKVSRRNVDATSKQGDVRWAPLHHFIGDLLNSTMTLSHYIIHLCTIVPLHRAHHVFGGLNNDDSIHVDSPTTLVFPSAERERSKALEFLSHGNSIDCTLIMMKTEQSSFTE